jgi:hypothetical protein
VIAVGALGATAISVPPALASTSQDSIIQDDSQLMANPAGTLQTFKELGVNRLLEPHRAPADILEAAELQRDRSRCLSHRQLGCV